MKVLGIVCSPRKNGNTETLVEEALSSARSYGAETEIINVSDKNITPCDGCESCVLTEKCKIKDDMQVIYEKLLQSDGIIFGSPVYFWNVSAQAKTIIDRTFFLSRKRQLRNKVAGAIVIYRNSGASFALSALNNFFGLQRMIRARSIGSRTEEEIASEGGCGVIAHADKRGEVSKNKQAMIQAQALGRAMVETIQVLSSHK
ncbi:flavodoxin family protein [Chloroflexota bacterium]